VRNKLVIFEDGTRAVVEGLSVQAGSRITEEVALDELDAEELALVHHERKDLQLERDEGGRIVGLKKGKSLLRLGQKRDNRGGKRS
jgi:hypothetical protein